MPMTTGDWLELIAAEGDRLRAEGPWTMDLATGSLRNEEGECPICCFARIMGSDTGHRLAFLWALRDVFGDAADDGSASPIAEASDGFRYTPETGFIHTFLFDLLCPRKG